MGIVLPIFFIKEANNLCQFSLLRHPELDSGSHKMLNQVQHDLRHYAHSFEKPLIPILCCNNMLENTICKLQSRRD